MIPEHGMHSGKCSSVNLQTSGTASNSGPAPTSQIEWRFCLTDQPDQGGSPSHLAFSLYRRYKEVVTDKKQAYTTLQLSRRPKIPVSSIRMVIKIPGSPSIPRRATDLAKAAGPENHLFVLPSEASEVD